MNYWKKPAKFLLDIQNFYSITAALHMVAPSFNRTEWQEKE